MHVSLNSLKDPWMLVLFRGHASMKQESHLGFVYRLTKIIPYVF